MTDGLDLNADDFSQQPWEYPGQLPPSSGLLMANAYRRLSPKELRRLGQAKVDVPAKGQQKSLNFELLMSNATQVDSRQLVVAVGSNASPAVMRRKFMAEKVTTTIPFIKGIVAGLRIGHSAHVSTPGYIPAAPLVAPSASTPVVVALLDSEQMGCLNSTEPNYDCIQVSSTLCQLELEGGERPSKFMLYTSHWGVLAPPGDDALSFASQEEVFRTMRARCRGFSELVGAGDYHVVMERLAADESLRGAAIAAFKSAGWVVDDGFDSPRVGSGDTYGSTPSSWEPLRRSEHSFVCVPTPNRIDRRGEQCVTLHPSDAEGLGNPSHVGIVGVQSPRLAPAPARLVLEDEQPEGTAGVDQVLRNALGTEVQELVELTPIRVRVTPISDFILSRPHFSMVRVQSADLATVEHNIGLLSPLSISILGIQDGDEVVVQGAPDSSGAVANVRMRAHAAPEEMTQRRDDISGGALTARFPSANDALGVYPDLPWIFLDSASRTKLGIGANRLSAVRIRASRGFQLNREFRELLLLLVLAFVGLAALINKAELMIGLFIVIFLLTAGIVRSRLRRRLGARD